MYTARDHEASSLRSLDWTQSLSTKETPRSSADNSDGITWPQTARTPKNHFYPARTAPTLKHQPPPVHTGINSLSTTAHHCNQLIHIASHHRGPCHGCCPGLLLRCSVTLHGHKKLKAGYSGAHVQTVLHTYIQCTAGSARQQHVAWWLPFQRRSMAAGASGRCSHGVVPASAVVCSCNCNCLCNCKCHYLQVRYKDKSEGAQAPRHITTQLV